MITIDKIDYMEIDVHNKHQYDRIDLYFDRTFFSN